MTEPIDLVGELAALLVQVGAKPVLMRERMAPSTLYDGDYHWAMIACAFVTHAKRSADGRRRILAPWLKLLQFVAARPRLAPDLRTWAETRRGPSLDTWRMMPRGYIGDRTHDAAIDFLVAAGMLEREKDEVLDGPRVAVLELFASRVEAAGLFAAERQVMVELQDVRANRTMLGGG